MSTDTLAPKVPRITSSRPVSAMASTIPSFSSIVCPLAAPTVVSRKLLSRTKKSLTSKRVSWVTGLTAAGDASALLTAASASSNS